VGNAPAGFSPTDSAHSGIINPGQANLFSGLQTLESSGHFLPKMAINVPAILKALKATNPNRVSLEFSCKAAQGFAELRDLSQISILAGVARKMVLPEKWR
jgi:hypothetical protein